MKEAVSQIKKERESKIKQDTDAPRFFSNNQAYTYNFKQHKAKIQREIMNKRAFGKHVKQENIKTVLEYE